MNLQCQVKKAFTPIAGTLLTVAILVTCIPQGILAISRLQKGDGSSEKVNDLSGTWRVYIGKLGEDISAASNLPSPVSITLQTQGNKLSGSVSVPKVIPGETGVKTEGAIKHQLINVNYNGKTLDFKVDDNGNTLEATLTKVTDNEFVGDWKSPVGPHWKSSKSQFSGKIILKR